MTSIPIGIATTILQNVEYALPGVSVEIDTSAALQSSILQGGTYTAFTSGIVTGCFIKCTTGDAIVTLRRNCVS